MRAASLAVLLLAAAASAVHTAGQAEPALTLYYTASLNGNLDGCACASQPRSGLVKRAAWLRGIDPERSVLVDGGDILDVRPDDLLAREILEAYAELGYDAVAVGDQEFSNGAEALLGYAETYPLLSHNLQVCPDETRCVLLNLSPLVVERAGLRIAFLSLVDPEVFRPYPTAVRETAKVTPPVEAAAGLMMRLADDPVDLVVLLYHGPEAGAEALLEAVPGIDVMVLAHDQRRIEPRKVGGALLVSPGQDGNLLGALELSPDGRDGFRHRNRFIEFDYARDPDDPATRARIDRYVRALSQPARSSR